jgi:hypothetical protein
MASGKTSSEINDLVLPTFQHPRVQQRLAAR